MNELTSAEITRIRDEAESSMFSTALIGTATITPPNPAPSAWTWGESVACGIRQNIGDEARDGSGANVHDAVIRLPISTTITTANRIKITHEFGIELASPEYYAVLGNPIADLTGLLVKAKRITGGSAL